MEQTAEFEIYDGHEKGTINIIEELKKFQEDIVALKQANGRLEKEVREIKEKNKQKSQTDGAYTVIHPQQPLVTNVAFTAALSVLSLNVSIGAHLVFDQVETNVGQAYSPATGIFTCPITVHYYFAHSALASFVDGFLETEIMLEGIPKSLIYCGDRRSFQGLVDYDQGANSVVVKCSQGERVWVQIYNNNGSVLFNERFTQFSGFLLWTE